MRFFNFFVFILLFFISCQAQDKSKTIASDETVRKIEIIDFYTTHRCKTCLKIEDNTKKMLQSDFKKEMDAGILSFQTVNVDEEANYDMAERFEAAGTALFINVVKNGKEQHIDLTDFAFMKAFAEEEFATELKAKIDEQLKTL
ncbi:nitrophenyl compound nitroreductase subunit ArsF family protein [bacterium]|nr:nitrophenyl compound nitroreductase subunit ArsF family protein [bacterium]